MIDSEPRIREGNGRTMTLISAGKVIFGLDLPHLEL